MKKQIIALFTLAHLLNLHAGDNDEKHPKMFINKNSSSSSSSSSRNNHQTRKCNDDAQHIPVHIRTMQGKLYTIDALPNTTFKEIKAILEQKSGIPAKEQCLCFGNFGRLSDESTVQRPKSIDDSKLFIDSLKYVGGHITLRPIKPKERLTFDKIDKKHQEKFINKNSSSSSSSSSRNNHQTRKCNDDAQHIPVRIRTMQGKLYTIDALPNTTFKEIKAILEQKSGIPAKEQCLCFGNFGRLSDESTVQRPKSIDKSRLFTDSLKCVGGHITLRPIKPKERICLDKNGLIQRLNDTLKASKHIKKVNDNLEELKFLAEKNYNKRTLTHIHKTLEKLLEHFGNEKILYFEQPTQLKILLSPVCNKAAKELNKL